jgi:hypothetical protein
LLRVGAVKKVGLDRVCPMRRSPAEGGASADAIYLAGETAGDLLTTLEYNLTAKGVDQLPVRTIALRVDAKVLPLFRAQLGKRADGLLEALEGLLQAHQKNSTDLEAGAEELTTLGATVFAVRRDATQRAQEVGTAPGAEA